MVLQLGDTVAKAQAEQHNPFAGQPQHSLAHHKIQQDGLQAPRSAGGLTTASSVGSECFEVQGLEDLVHMGKLGQGSSGLVEKHRHLGTGLELALKIIQAGDIAAVQRKAILLELRTFAKCKSPHIVDFYGAFFHENSIYIALEYMDAGALSSILERRRTVPEPLLANVTWQVLDGLQYLHDEMHVIHRDIKPSNLLLSFAGVVKITDFGVSGELEDDLEQKNKVTFVGTMYYMSPERVIGKPYGYNSDMWSLGLTLVECLLGRYPYARSDEGCARQLSFWELMRRIVEQESPCLPPEANNSALLRDFLEQVLRKEPQGRPGAAEMKAHDWLGFGPLGPSFTARSLELAAWIADSRENTKACGATTEGAVSSGSRGAGSTGWPSVPGAGVGNRSPSIGNASSSCTDEGANRCLDFGLSPTSAITPSAATSTAHAADATPESAPAMAGRMSFGSPARSLGLSLRGGGENPFARFGQQEQQGRIARPEEDSASASGVSRGEGMGLSMRGGDHFARQEGGVKGDPPTSQTAASSSDSAGALPPTLPIAGPAPTMGSSLRGHNPFGARARCTDLEAKPKDTGRPEDELAHRTENSRPSWPDVDAATPPGREAAAPAAPFHPASRDGCEGSPGRGGDLPAAGVPKAMGQALRGQNPFMRPAGQARPG